jgi:hypothetical protein
MELLATVLAALRLAHRDVSALGVSAQLRQAARHVGKIVVRYAPTLRAAPGKGTQEVARRGEHKTLGALVSWLFGECVRVEPAYRRECQRLFVLLAPTVVDKRTAAAWIGERVGRTTIVDTFGAFQPPPAPKRAPSDTPTLDELLAQHLELLRSIDALYFFVDRRLFDARRLLFLGGARSVHSTIDVDATQAITTHDIDVDDTNDDDDDKESHASPMLSAAREFVTRLPSVRAAFERGSPTPLEREQFNTSAATVLAALIALLVRLWQREPDALGDRLVAFAANEVFVDQLLRVLFAPPSAAIADGMPSLAELTVLAPVEHDDDRDDVVDIGDLRACIRTAMQLVVSVARAYVCCTCV